MIRKLELAAVAEAIARDQETLAKVAEKLPERPKMKSRAERRNEARDQKTLTGWKKRQRVRDGRRGTEKVLDY